jgi:hypothetical protein
MQRCQPHVPCACRALALVLDVVEELGKERSIEVGHNESGWLRAKALLGEVQEQTKRATIRRNGVGARLQLPEQTVNEERLQ